MGLVTIDSHSQREHTEIHKIPKFGVNQASFDSDTAIYGHQEAVFRQHPDGPYISFFVNFDIFKWLCRAYFWVYLH